MVGAIGLGCAGMAVTASATPKQASTTGTQWKQEVTAAVASLTSGHNKVETDTGPGNKGTLEVDLGIASNDVLVLAALTKGDN